MKVHNNYDCMMIVKEPDSQRGEQMSDQEIIELYLARNEDAVRRSE